MENKREELGKCPECGKPVYEGRKSFYCSGYNEGCRFVLWKNGLERLGHADITPAQARVLLKNETIPLIGLKSKNGNKFDAEGRLTEDEKYGWQIGLIFGDIGQEKQDSSRQKKTESPEKGYAAVQNRF